MIRTALAFLVAALVLIGCGAEDDERAVHLYCQYGASSEAQLEGCVRKMTIDDVRGYDTNAAKYALNALDECLGDTGPLCEDEPYAVDPRQP